MYMYEHTQWGVYGQLWDSSEKLVAKAKIGKPLNAKK